jgi:nicotinate-nucleotide pyrophosphorylase (carboxylating)
MDETLDVREEILRKVEGKRVTAALLVDEEGMVSGIASAKEEASRLGLSVLRIIPEGSEVRKGDEIIRFSGTPKQVVMAEEILIGLLAKASGIATQAHKFVRAAEGKPKIVCGAWKKMPPSLKEVIREAIIAGGASSRIEPHPFAYLDKTYVELLGGIKRSLEAVASLNGVSKVIQVRGKYQDIVSEACEAAECGAHIVFIDTGKQDDVRRIVERLRNLGLRDKVKIAFGGGVNLEAINELKTLDIDILDIGRQIVDAPLLDMRLEIIEFKG